MVTWGGYHIFKEDVRHTQRVWCKTVYQKLVPWDTRITPRRGPELVLPLTRVFDQELTFQDDFGGIAEFPMRLINFLVIEVNVALEPGNLWCLSGLLRDIQPHPIQIFRIWGSPCITRVFAHFQRGRSVNSAHEGGITRRKSNLTKLSLHTLLTSYVPFTAFLSLAKTSFVK